LQPRIWITRDINKLECKGRIIDTSAERRPDTSKPYLIRALHPDGTFGLHIADLNQLGLENFL